ncbi:MAG: GNAT family N-acetyltransferase [Oscillospiraceae bacterium]|nr:GNAT family N-acetyltransferase [Oscillospiraceae bacterium]
MNIRYAEHKDADIINTHDEWINREMLIKKIEDKQIYVVYDGDNFVGWLRYGLFWDTTPFMNMLYLLERYRGKGIGKQLVIFWENDMKSKGYKTLLTSSAQNEYAQHFYTKLGYESIGGFVLEKEPFEIMFVKFV